MKEQKENKAFIVPPERKQFQAMLAKNINYFGNIPGSKLKPVYKLISDVTYEQLTCVGYNPDTENMEATFAVKKPTGYSGDLCSAGSPEFIRFYLDHHDGAGFIDQGCVVVNVHDIPSSKDCSGNSIFPINYVATLKKKPSASSFCDTPKLPTLRAILSWNNEPPVNSPGWHPAWGGVMDCDVQLKPKSKPFHLHDFDLSKYFELAAVSPNLTIKQLSELVEFNIHDIIPQPDPPPFHELVKKYSKANVPASRFAYKTIHNMIKFPASEITMQNKTILSGLKIEYESLIDKFGVLFPVDKSKANVDYEELECVGLDYNTENLVATIKIKKKAGYSGTLCDAGSKEYVAFWIDWNDSCKWQYLNTVELKVHDINMPGDHLCYSVALPLDATFHRKKCVNPKVLRVRGVLSWNVAPSTTDPDHLEYYGNRVDTHVQIKPGPEINPGDLFPWYNIIGGIDVSHVDDVTGLTKPGSFFAYNGLSVPTGASFGGVIVLNGPTFPGHRYRVKITKPDSTFYYAMDTFVVVGWLPVAPYVQFTTQTPDINGYYNFLNPDQNTLNVLSRFTPVGEDKLTVEMEVEGVIGTFVKTIQMDNTYPVVQLQVNDNGDCSHFKKGDTITGHYYVNDLNIWYWSFWSTYGGNATGTVNTPAAPGTAFSIGTGPTSYPCGTFGLYAVDKTIVNSQSVGHEVSTQYNVCLK
jgi:hypothetical protein